MKLCAVERRGCESKFFLRLFCPCLVLLMLLLVSCSSKVTPPPPVDVTNDSGSYDNGTNTNYPGNGSLGGNDPFSEENLPVEGTLDDTSGGQKGEGDYGVGGVGNYGVLEPDLQSHSHKKQHGRCTTGFSPIYFAFDQARISSDMMSSAERNASYLKKNPSINIRLEGNSDQRGTSEYNMALSERRAMNVLRYLQDVGIDISRIRTVAYGEEMPLFSGNTEEDHQYNRRVDFVAE